MNVQFSYNMDTIRIELVTSFQIQVSNHKSRSKTTHPAMILLMGPIASKFGIITMHSWHGLFFLSRKLSIDFFFFKERSHRPSKFFTILESYVYLNLKSCDMLTYLESLCSVRFRFIWRVLLTMAAPNAPQNGPIAYIAPQSGERPPSYTQYNTQFKLFVRLP
jgi:hypothetical protein